MSKYVLSRGWHDHHQFEGDEFSRRDAWSWLIGEAAWKDAKRRVNGKIIILKRGQLSHSIRYMAEKWLWHPTKVQRFLKALKADTMIDTESDTGQLIITICNYTQYQLSPKEADTASDTETDKRAIQERYKEEEIKEVKEDNTTHDTRAGVPSPFQTIFEEGIAVFPMLATANTSSIHQWIAAGCDPNLDAVPEIRRHAGKPIRAWSYFTGGILDSKATRETPLPEGRPKESLKQKRTARHTGFEHQDYRAGTEGFYVS